MPLVQSKQIVAKFQFPDTDDARYPAVLSAEYVVPTGGRAINDVIELGQMPPNAIVTGCSVHVTAGGAGATADFGYLSGTYGDASAATGQARTCGSDFFAAGSVAAAGVLTLVKPQTGPSRDDDLTGWGLRVTGAVWPAGMIIRAHLSVRSEIVGLV